MADERAAQVSGAGPAAGGLQAPGEDLGLRQPERGSLLDRAGLTLARVLAPALRPVGVDPTRFVALVDVRMKLGRRRTTNDGRPPGAKGQLVTFFIAILAGCGAAIAASAVPDPAQGLTIAISITALLTGLFQALDLGTLLFDPAEANVVLPTPTGPRTAYAARLAHGLWGQGWIVAGTLLPLVLYGVFVRELPRFSIAAIPGVIGGAATMFALLVFFLLLAVRGKDPARIQNLAVYMQIGVLAIFYIGLQVMAGGTRSGSLWERMQLGFGPLSVLYPPAWYGGLLAVMGGDLRTLQVVLAVLAVVGPPLALALALGAARGGHLAASAASNGTLNGGNGRRRGGWVRGLARALRLSPLQRAGFETAGALAGREQAFRQRTWPSLVYPVVVGGGTMLRDPELAGEMAGIWVLMPAILLPAILIHARYTRNPGALWLLEAAPVAKPGPIIAGGRKLFLLTVALVPSLAFALAWVVLRPIEELPVVLGTLSLAWALSVWMGVLVERRLPFSEHAPAHTRPEGMGFVLAAMGVGTLGFLISLTFQLSAAIAWGAAATGALAALVGWRRLGA